MNYASLDDMRTRFGDEELVQLTDRENHPASVIDESVVAKALGDAHSLIDGYISGRHTLPFVTVPFSLVRAACDIARKYLHGERASEAVVKAHDAAVKFLVDVSLGRVKLDIQGEAPSPVGSPIWSEPERVFTDDTLKGY